jgi:hypothetical protein
MRFRGSLSQNPFVGPVRNSCAFAADRFVLPTRGFAHGLLRVLDRRPIHASFGQKKEESKMIPLEFKKPNNVTMPETLSRKIEHPGFPRTLRNISKKVPTRISNEYTSPAGVCQAAAQE